MVLEEARHLLIDILDALLLLLVRVQDLEEGAVGAWLVLEGLLDLGHVVDRLVEVDRRLLVGVLFYGTPILLIHNTKTTQQA